MLPEARAIDNRARRRPPGQSQARQGVYRLSLESRDGAVFRMQVLSLGDMDVVYPIRDCLLVQTTKISEPLPSIMRPHASGALKAWSGVHPASPLNNETPRVPASPSAQG